MTLGAMIIDCNRSPIGDSTKVRIAIFERGEYVVVASGHWYEDKILNYVGRKVNSYYMNLIDNIITINVEGDLII